MVVADRFEEAGWLFEVFATRMCCAIAYSVASKSLLDVRAVILADKEGVQRWYSGTFLHHKQER
jgi:hypothetical protein